MTKTTVSILVMALALILVLPVNAQDHDNAAFIKDYAGNFNEASKKLADLAGAMPADMFGWRPAEGIRSTSEIYMHVADVNMVLASSLGVAISSDGPKNLEREITEKEQVIEILKASQKPVQEALAMLVNEDLGRTVQAFGQDFTRYRVLMIISGHLHEHLGQAIAYARSNNIAPPWSRGGGQ